MDVKCDVEHFQYFERYHWDHILYFMGSAYTCKRSCILNLLVFMLGRLNMMIQLNVGFTVLVPICKGTIRVVQFDLIYRIYHIMTISS